MTDDDDDGVLYWQVGDIARCYSQSVGVVDVEVTAANVDELNDGENPLYPWRVERIERVVTEGNGE